ncbi:hypothetical protein AA16373_1742 [Komagataeibacter swingsii DSM 16373]|nr:hypothetical protein AA16373_1742 [Komagataeibacter swingsii DSM 16373]
MDRHNYNLTVSFHTGDSRVKMPHWHNGGPQQADPVPDHAPIRGVGDRTGSKVMHTLTLVLATAAIVAGMAASDDLRRAPQASDTCVLTCMLRSPPR